MSDLSKKDISELPNAQKLNNYKNILLKERKRILDRITSLNQKYSSTNLRYAKKVIGEEIDVLEFELEKVDSYLRNCFFDKRVLLDNIKNKQDEINEIEFLIKINELPESMKSELLSKKLDLNSFICESILRNNLSNGNRNFASATNIVEVEKIVEVPKIVEVEKVIEVPTIVEVEKTIEVEKPYEVEKIVTVPEIVEVEKVVEKIIEVPTLIGVDKVVEVPKIVEVDTNGNTPIINTDEITDSINRLSEQVSNNVSYNQELFNQLNQANDKLEYLEKSLSDSVNAQPTIQKEVEPIYIETPVLVQHPYYDEEPEYEEEYIETQETPTVDEIRNVVVEEYYPVEEEEAQTAEPIVTQTVTEEIIPPEPKIEVIVENPDDVPDITINNERVTPVVTTNPPVEPQLSTKTVQQEVYEEVDDDYFDDDDDFDSAFE